VGTSWAELLLVNVTITVAWRNSDDDGSSRLIGPLGKMRCGDEHGKMRKEKREENQDAGE
jgi:hypothetical protein